MNIYVIQEYFLRTDVFLIPELVHLDRTLERITDSVAREIYIIKGERLSRLSSKLFSFIS